MFIYQRKINGKDAVVCVSETVDQGKFLPLENGAAFALYEAEAGKLVAVAGTFTDGEFEADEDNKEE